MSNLFTRPVPPHLALNALVGMDDAHPTRQRQFDGHLGFGHRVRWTSQYWTGQANVLCDVTGQVNLTRQQKSTKDIQRRGSSSKIKFSCMANEGNAYVLVIKPKLIDHSSNPTSLQKNRVGGSILVLTLKSMINPHIDRSSPHLKPICCWRLQLGPKKNEVIVRVLYQKLPQKNSPTTYNILAIRSTARNCLKKNKSANVGQSRHH